MSSIGAVRKTGSGAAFPGRASHGTAKASPGATSSSCVQAHSAPFSVASSVETFPIWLCVKNRYPKWNPGKWKKRLKPVILWWFHFDPYEFRMSAFRDVHGILSVYIYIYVCARVCSHTYVHMCKDTHECCAHTKAVSERQRAYLCLVLHLPRFRLWLQ